VNAIDSPERSLDSCERYRLPIEEPCTVVPLLEIRETFPLLNNVAMLSLKNRLLFAATSLLLLVFSHALLLNVAGARDSSVLCELFRQAPYTLLL